MRTRYYDYGPIGERIQRARKAKGITQEKLGNIIDMNSKNVSQIERGLAGISIPSLMEICKALEVSADYILFGIADGNDRSVIGNLLARLPESKQMQAEKLLEVFVEAVE